MKIRFSLLFILVVFAANGQTKLTISGKTFTNSDDTWLGVDIPRTEKTTLVFKNNSITSINRYGYQLQAGDEGVRPTNNNLDGAVITGNKFSWSGTDYNDRTTAQTWRPLIQSGYKIFDYRYFKSCSGSGQDNQDLRFFRKALYGEEARNGRKPQISC